MKVKKILAALLVASICSTAALAGCSVSKSDSTSTGGSSTASSTDSKSSSNEPVTVTIKQFKAEIDEQLGKDIEKYKSVAPNVTITYQSIGAGTDIGTVLKADMSAGTMPTIFNAIGPSEYEVYKDYLEDLSDQPWVSHATKGSLDLLTVDGKVYGLPVSTEGLGLVVNKKIFDDAGVDISNLKSMKDFDDAFSKLDAKIKDGSLANVDSCKNLKAVTAVQGAETWVLGDHAENIFLVPEFEGDPFKAYNSKTVEMKYADTYKDYTDMMLKYSEFADNKKGAVTYTYSGNAIPDISTGKVAVIQQGNWAYNEINKIDEETAKNLTLLPMPIGGDNQDAAMISILSQYWTVNSKASDAEKTAAKDFLNWLYQSDEGKDIVVNSFGFIPVFDNYGDLAPSDPLSKAVVDLSSSGKVVNAVFKGTPDGWGQNVFGAAVQAYISGEKTWDEVVKTAQDGWAEAKK